jgi:hypothetical protein
MPLQTGTWKINSNGVLGTLAISSVDPQGKVQGQLTFGGSSTAILGLWDEISAKLKFTASDSGGVTAYTGYMWADQFRMPGITGGSVLTLAGHYETSNGSADKFAFGWYAQIGQA